MIWEHPPQRHVHKKLEPHIGRQRSVKPQPPSIWMDSPWVDCRVFLDRAAAFDRGAGRSGEVRHTPVSARPDWVRI